MAIINLKDRGVLSDAVYIGQGSKWGNPYVIGRDGTRDEVCDMYEARLASQIDSESVSLEELASLHGKDLLCFCAPLRCHGEILELASAWAVEQLGGTSLL